MKRMATLLFLLTALFVLPSSAEAARSAPSVPKTLREVIGMIRGGGSVIIPADWDGEYTYTDTTYDCQGTPTGTDADLDTLCSGQVVYGDETMQCSGSASSTVIDVTCTSTSEFDSCTVDFTFTLHATRSGDNIYAVSTVMIDYSGTGQFCDLIPDSCDQTNTRLTRIGPAPQAYCSTSSRRSTWGEVKTLYR